MQESQLSRDTQAVLLLCGRFSPREQAKPLELREYNRVVDVLRKNGKTPNFFFDASFFDLDWPAAGLELSRLRALAERGMALGLAAERWVNRGLWVISRSDDDYPSRLRQHLGWSAPPLLWGAGERGLLNGGGVAIVGSRDIDQEALRWTEVVAARCAAGRLNVISGGARGADQAALAGALRAGGAVICVLPEGLGKPSVISRYRAAIVEERMSLISPFYPDAGFTVGNAMARNKIIYGLAESAVIVRADANRGGTWAGAEEELKRENHIPLFVRTTEPMEEGARALLAIGAQPFASSPWGDLIIPSGRMVPAVSVIRDAAVRPTGHSEPVDPVREESPASAEEVPPTAPTVYEAVLPLLLLTFAKPTTVKSAAERLEVQEKQLKSWIERAVTDGRLASAKGRPIRFVTALRVAQSNDDAPQQTMFGTRESD
jgi:predicted Rossmann fold nucleotide-binding protein DprA/Smf involved in DNA uptake